MTTDDFPTEPPDHQGDDRITALMARATALAMKAMIAVQDQTAMDAVACQAERVTRP